MARLARLVLPGVPHHVTHRGNRRQDLFFDDADRQVYGMLLADHLARTGCRLWCYCWMTNHVHLIVVPEREDSLARGIGVAHQRFAREINRRHGLTGHLFEGRYYSTPLSDEHLIAAARYVERNPVRARLVRTAADWPWSSAAAHTGRKPDGLLAEDRPLPAPDRIGDWEKYLSEPEDEAMMLRLRRTTKTGQPCGEPSWVREIEARTGRANLSRPPGRPAKAIA